jgi:uncharacterized protein YhaN
MKFTDLDVTGFGVWSGLRLESLSPQLTVVYGPNEAGKTTILECLRGVLYGFTPARRDRYLPPAHGGAGGGAIAARIDRSSYTIERRDDGTRMLGGVTITGPDGLTQGQSQLSELLAGIEESAYTSVFCVGLRELQELATLNDGEAAAWLYELSTGLDGVSVSDVLRELRTSRTRLLSPAGAGEKSQIADLVAQRETLRTEIDGLAMLNDRYWQLGAERDAADEAIRAAEASQAGASTELQKLDTALAVRELWQERASLEQKLAAYGRLGDFPEDALARYEQIVAGLQHMRLLRARLKKRWQKLRVKRKAIKVNEHLWRQAARISALAEHESWIAALDDQVRSAEHKVGEYEGQLAAVRVQIGLSAEATVSSGGLANIADTRLPAMAKQLVNVRKNLKQARNDCRLLKDERGARREEVARALAGRGQASLAEALEKQGQLVAQYRRRLQLDMRLDQLAMHRKELEQKHLRLLDRQVLPLWLLIALAVVFVLGAGLVLAGLIIPWGSATAIIGGLIAAAAAGGKIGIERSAANRLEATEKQLKLLSRQIDQSKDEREELDAQLPAGGGAMASRLQSAEAELASLEELLSLDARRQSADEQASTARGRLKAAQDEWKHARRRWQQSLGEVGLPSHLSPAQLKQMTAHAGSLATLERQLGQARDDRDRCRREQAAVAARIAAVAADTGCKNATAGATRIPLVEQLRILRRELAAQEELVSQRQSIERRLTRTGRLAAKYKLRVQRLIGRRRALFGAAGAYDEADFRRRAGQRAIVDELLQRRVALNQQIQTSLGGQGEEEVAARLGQPVGLLEQQREEILARQRTVADDIKRLAESRGRVAHEQSLLADDRRVAHKQLELSTVEVRLSEAVSRWQTLAVAEHLIQSVKEQYERDRQPEVLQEASRYLERLTEGRYRRAWTPLGEPTLRVDDDQGRSLPIELLSTGAREQLFLALRLALAARYARQGKSLPLVLDDVLVNFDARRARAAAAMIVDFAAAGCQLLLFTCHEHIADMFRMLECDVRQLPVSSNGEPKVVGPTITKHPLAAEPPRRRREKRSKEPPPVDAANEPVAATKLETIQMLAAAAPSPIFAAVAEPPTAHEEAAPIAEPSRAADPDRQHRADPPHPIAPAKLNSRRHRWSAEEFDGELEDQVNAAFASATLFDGKSSAGDSD